MQLAAETRTETGKGAARKIRRQGLIPAVVYANGNEAQHLQVSPKAVLDIYRNTRNRNTIIELQVDGQSIPVLLADAQRHPVSRDLLHIDFYKVGDKEVVVDVPVTTTGKPAGASLGGRVRIIRRTLKAKCHYAKIPESFVVDVSPMNIEDIVMASEVPTPDGVELVYDRDFNVVTVYGKKRR